MKLTRYNPLQELQRLDQDLDKFWSGAWNIFPTLADLSAMDLYEEDGKLVAEVSLPSFKKEEIKVKAEEGVLEISAEHREEDEDKGKRRYYFRESSNRYLRRVALPDGASTDKAEAGFKDGVLRVAIPMTTPAKKEPKQIDIK